MTRMRQLIEEHLASSGHLSKRHVHPRMLKMLEMGGMSAVFTRAEGQYLYDREERRFLDYLSGGGVYFIGRNHPAVREALTDVLEGDLPNLCVVNASILGGLLAERLLRLSGDHFGKVVYANSGAEAIEVSIRFARYLTRRRRFLHLEGGFHGRTYGAISLCGFEQMKEGMEPRLPVCTPIRRNDLQALKSELSNGDVAAFFFEPVQGMTGEVLDADFLREAESLCARYGTLFVADEIQTGLGRTGAWFASRELGLKPAMMTVSKTLSGGHVPVSALLISEEIYRGVYEKFKAGPIYFSTFAENNLAMAAGIATLDVLEEMNAPARARELGDRLRDGLTRLAGRYDCIERIAGKGLLLAIYFRSSARARLRLQQELLGTADQGAFAAAVNADLFSRQRVLVQIPGPELNAVKVLPPVITTEQDVAHFLGAFEDTLAHFYGAGGPVVSLGAAVLQDALRSVRDLLPGAPLAAKQKSARTDHARPQEFADYRGPIREHAEFLIIGSGPGGTILARKLAAQGRSVIVLESGPIVRPADFDKDAGRTLSRYFWDGGLRATRGNVVMPTMQARCLGGGSVFNSAICMRAPAFVLERWADEHGVQGLTERDLDPHYRTVEEFMEVRPVEERVQGRRNQLFRQACEEMGWRAEPIVRNEKGCKGSGECFTGCPNGAKRSLDRRGVPELLEAGGRIYSSVEASRLIIDRHRVRGATGWVVDPSTGRRTHRARVTASCTILAAGALASPVIMQNSGLSRAPIGGNLRFHPAAAVMGLFDDDISPWNGATQGYHCLDFLEEGLKLESLWASKSLLASRFPSSELEQLMAQYRHVASWDVFVSGDDSVGRVRTLPAARPDLSYHVGQGDVRRVQEGIAKLIEMFFSVGARSVLSGIHSLPARMTDASYAGIVRRAHLEASDLPLGSNHVFGTTAMGADLDRYACDSSGAVHEVDDLYVCDTGLFPASPAVNPMLTVMALADRMGDTLQARY